MAFVQLGNIDVSFGARDLIKSATLTLAEGSRAALAGPNGAGKSTLMKIAAGLLKPDSGDIAVTKGARISYLPQTNAALGGGTVREEAEEAFAHIHALLEKQEELGRQLQDPDIEEKLMARCLEEFDAIACHVEASGFYRREERIAEVLSGLGFRREDFSRPAAELSGGWQMRLALAKILLEDPDIMLLDEPTNYLDLEARTWLEGFLGGYRGGVLLVSHDRYFLDVTVKEVYELFNGKLSRYPGIYSSYEERRARELEAIFEAWERQQEEIQHMEEFIRRFRYKESKASQVQSRVKMLEKIVPIEIPEGMKKIHFSFPPPPHSGKIVVRMGGLSKSYGSLKVIDNLDLDIERGSKIAFVGPNGAGKSTLMRLIAGTDTLFEGSLGYGTGVEVAYFAQDSAEQMAGGNTAEEEVASVCPNPLLPKLRNMLGAFLFRGDDVEKPVSVLSGGERSRLALLKMLLHPANLLVLDEPTNHLDLTSKDVLLEALKRFEGTVLFVSHDRGFIDELADKVLELEAGRTPRLFLGGYSYYAEKKAAEAAAAEEGRAAQGAEGAEGAGRRDTGSRPRQADRGLAPETDEGRSAAASWEEDKAKKTRLRKLRKREEELLARLGDITGEKNNLERSMALPGNYSNGAKVKEILAGIASLDAETASLNEEWMEIAETLSLEDGE